MVPYTLPLVWGVACRCLSTVWLPLQCRWQGARRGSKGAKGASPKATPLIGSLADPALANAVELELYPLCLAIRRLDKARASVADLCAAWVLWPPLPSVTLR